MPNPSATPAKAKSERSPERTARSVSHPASAANRTPDMPCIPMRLQMMSHRIVAAISAAVKPTRVPADRPRKREYGEYARQAEPDRRETRRCYRDARQLDDGGERYQEHGRQVG